MSEIHLDVFTELNKRAIQKAAKDIEQQYEKMGGRAQAAFNKRAEKEVEKSAQKMARLQDKVANAQGRVRAERAKLQKLSKQETRDRAKEIVQEEKLNAAIRERNALRKRQTQLRRDEADRVKEFLNTELQAIQRADQARERAAAADQRRKDKVAADDERRRRREQDAKDRAAAREQRQAEQRERQEQRDQDRRERAAAAEQRRIEREQAAKDRAAVAEQRRIERDQAAKDRAAVADQRRADRDQAQKDRAAQRDRDREVREERDRRKRIDRAVNDIQKNEVKQRRSSGVGFLSSALSGNRQDTTGGRFLGRLGQLNDVGASTRFIARGMFTAGAPVTGPLAISALLNAANAAVTATQSIMLLPAAGAAGAAAFGALTVGASGFSDTIKEIRDPEKFAEAIQGISPNAQQAALSIQSLLPELDKLKMSSQDALFQGAGEQLTQLADTYLPSIQDLFTSLNTSFNQMFQNVGNMLQQPGTQAEIGNIIENLKSAFHELEPAVADVASAFITMASAGSNFLPEIASGAANAAEAFRLFVEESVQSGTFEEKLRDGLNTLKDLVELVIEVGHLIFDNFDNGSGSVRGFITLVEKLNNGLKATGDFLHGVGVFMEHTVNALIHVVNGVIHTINAAADAANWLLTLGPLNDKKPFGNIPTIDTYDNVQKGGQHSNPESLGPDSGLPGLNRNPFGPPVDEYGKTAGDRQRERRGLPPLPKAGLPPWMGGDVPGAPSKDKNPPFVDPGRFQVNGMPALGGAPGLGPVGAPGIQPPGTSTPGFGPEGKFGTYTVDPEDVFRAENNVVSQRNSLEEARLRLINLEDEGNASQLELLRAKNNVAEQEASYTEALMKLNDAQRGTFKELDDNLKNHANALDDIGAQLDNDLGISKGLPGIADNIVRFLASLAFAPAMGALAAVRQNGMIEAGLSQSGTGLLGMFMNPLQSNGSRATGSFPVMGRPQGMLNASAFAGGASPFRQPGAALPGESARDFAHRVMMPYFQNQGFTVGDHAADKYGEHQNGALDIMVKSLAEGQKVLQQVLSDPNVYGAIFDNKTYGYGHGLTPQDYSAGHTGNPTQDHQDHVHALYKPGGGNNLNPNGIPLVMPGMYSGAPGLGSSGATPVFVVNMPGAGFQIPGLGGSDVQSALASGPGQGILSPDQWAKIADAEAGGDWAINSGNGFFGGLQIKQSTWDQFGGGQYATRPDLASPQEQMDIGNKIFAGQGQSAWPATASAHPEWFQPSSVQTPTPGLGTPGTPGAPGGVTPGGGGNLFPQFNPASLNLQQPGANQQPIGYNGQGGFQPAGGGFAGLGGAPMGAIQGAIEAAGSAAAPFGGQAAAAGAQMLMQILNRTAGFAGQAAAIGIQGLGQTFLPAGSQMGDMNNNILGRIAAGFAGARPAQATSAGKQDIPDKDLAKMLSSADPNTTQHGQGASPGPGNAPLIGQMNVQDPKDGQKIAREVQFLNAYGAGGGR